MITVLTVIPSSSDDAAPKAARGTSVRAPVAVTSAPQRGGSEDRSEAVDRHGSRGAILVHSDPLILRSSAFAALPAKRRHRLRPADDRPRDAALRGDKLKSRASAAPRVRALLVTLLLLATSLAGCTTDTGQRAGPCAGVNVDGDAFCAPTTDGWGIHGKARAGGASAAPTVFLVHGVGEAGYVFDALVEDLLPVAGGVVTFDLRGHGDSTKRNGDARTWQDFSGNTEFALAASDLVAVVLEAERSLGDRAIVTVGASLGANLALRHAAGRAADVGAVVLLSPGLDYRGVTTEKANADYVGRVLYVASEDDAYAAESARALEAKTGAREHALKMWQDKGHGTNLLDEEGRAFVVDWLAEHALS